MSSDWTQRDVFVVATQSLRAIQFDRDPKEELSSDWAVSDANCAVSSDWTQRDVFVVATQSLHAILL
ncbi:MAG: hypothetical protein AB7I18_09505 [Candidatus Berkiella sp.]